MIEIRDEVGFLLYLKEVVMPTVVELKEVVYLDAGDDIHQRVESYFANSYKGLALFVGVYDGEISDRAGSGRYVINAQLTILIKHNKVNVSELPGVRRDARVVLTKVLGKIKNDCDTAMVENVGYRYEIDLVGNKFHAVSNFANVSAYGYSVDFDLNIGVDAFLN
jgi:hypothetical protein